jgi:DNA-binding NarL/FixJ family response regulator
MKRQVRVLLVEDHFLARMALRGVLNGRRDMTLVAETGNGVQAVELYRQHRPDVTIMDLGLPQLSGLEAIGRIRQLDGAAQILVLTNFGGSEDVHRALEAGASGYLGKDTGGEELIEAILTVDRGERYLPEPIARRLAERTPASELTARELAVLDLLVKGCTNREIAHTLVMAEKTARIHVSNILRKLEVADRTEAAVAAVQRGIIHLD